MDKDIPAERRRYKEEELKGSPIRMTNEILAIEKGLLKDKTVAQAERIKELVELGLYAKSVVIRLQAEVAKLKLRVKNLVIDGVSLYEVERAKSGITRDEMLVSLGAETNRLFALLGRERIEKSIANGIAEYFKLIPFSVTDQIETWKLKDCIATAILNEGGK